MLFLLSCGSEKSVEQSSSSYFVRDIGVSKPVFYDISSSEECNSSQKGGLYTRWLNGFTGEVELKKVSSRGQGKYIATSAISGLYAHSKMDFLDERIDSLGEKISLCHDKVYSLNSIEQVAINTITVLDKTYEKLISIKSEYKNIDPVYVFIHPEFKRYHSKEEKEGRTVYNYYLATNNASYSRYDENSYRGGAINIYPASKEFLSNPQKADKKKAFGGLPFWNFPFVIAHEYGHHFLDNYIIENFFKNEIKFSRFKTPSFVEYPFDKIDKVERLYGFLHEQFADYFAHYLVERKYRKFKNVTCLEMNRELESSKFFNYESSLDKILTSNRLRVFKREEATDYIKPCNLVFTDKYKIASIFNYLFFSINRAIGIDDIEAIRVLEVFFKKIAQNEDKIVNSLNDADFDNFFESFLKIYLSIINSSKFINNTEKIKVCTSLKEVIPALYDSVGVHDFDCSVID